MRRYEVQIQRAGDKPVPWAEWRSAIELNVPPLPYLADPYPPVGAGYDVTHATEETAEREADFIHRVHGFPTRVVTRVI